ncbi:UDP-glucuronosyltransferase 2A3 [Nasonia vitripennis]|uniref:UDP-glucuronosyltransferase n=1 Tax=Nasonia vitripennis TaxID=7425 RepID=A0A7M7PZ67_NASVI|nr:UDP-glucuronosyltransferase 2A3 [Nasonia vitripennis]XP_031777449.1 UDP-glucuronosyltransferase 2A3 [Nasonia vitripennis]XP_032457315.1 UDP-glucuronosyltransferase 2A3 [Nasonia vitripennis]
MTRPSAKLAAAFLLLVLSCRVTEGLRILGLFPLHGKSHFVMCEALMRGLAARGHQVDVYSHFPLKQPVANYTDFSLAGSIPLLSNSMSFELMNSFGGDSISIPQLLKLGADPICELLNLPIFQKLLRQPPSDPPYDVVIVELFLANCYLAWGRHLNAPTVSVVTTSIFDWLNEPLGNPTNLAVEPSVFSKTIAPMNFYERLSNVLMSTYVKWSFNYHARSQDAIVKKLFGPDMPDVIELQKDIALTLVNYHHALNGLRPYSPAIVPVGGLHVLDSSDPLPKEVQKFMDDSKSGFIYISFGSMVRIETFPKPMLDAFYKTFAKIAPVRVLMKIAKPEELPAGLPSNVMTQPWLNQVKVLKHKNIRAFVTHGGLMGTQESIYHGVPMIGVPLFGDQHFNVESYVKRNMAIKLIREDITEENFGKAVNEILSKPIYKKSAEKAGAMFRDVPMGPMDTAAFWIEYVARHGKDALRSPVIDMPWWQAKLYDVYGFLLLLVALALCVVRIAVKKVCGLFCTKSCPPAKTSKQKKR